MRRFCIKLVLFVIILVPAVALFAFLSTTDSFRTPIAELTHSDDYITINNGPDEIGPYIDKAREHNNYTKLIIGDSVCHQMYTDLQEYNDEICILGSNAAISMAGQYVLLHEFLDNHTDVTDVWLIIIPSSMSVYFDTQYGYQYVVMPNVEKDTIRIFEPNTVEQLGSVYGKLFLNEGVVWFLDRSAPARKIYLNLLLKYGEGFGDSPMSPVSVQYMTDMIDLCRKKNVNLHLLPSPVSEANKDRYERALTGFRENGFDKFFPDYEAAVVYYPDDQFRDGVHFGGEYDNQASFNEKIRQLGDESLLKYLKFE